MEYKEQVKAALAGLREYVEASQYYEGTIPEGFASAKVRRALEVSGETEGLNVCRTVVDAVGDRLEIASVQATAGQEIINALWENDLSLEVQEIHRRALVYGDAYAIVWPGEDGETEITYNSPLTMTLVYDPENPRRKLYAVKLWIADGHSRMNIYTAENVYRLQAQGEQVTESTNWSTLEVLENPFNEVPVFKFSTHRSWGRPEHRSAYAAQRSVTKHFVNSLVTAEYLAAPQRYALSRLGGNEVDLNDFDETKTDAENMGALKNSPGTLWYLKGIDQVGTFPAADAKAFWEPIQNSIQIMASITSTPLHFFSNDRANVSGESLRVAEAPLLTKVRQRQMSFADTWRELFRFVLKINNVEADVEIKWIARESLDELERLDATLKKINAGLSHRQALRELGYDEELITQILAERQQEAAEGMFYQRSPKARVSTEYDETNKEME